MLGLGIVQTGLGLLNSNSQKKQAKQQLAAQNDIAQQTLAQQNDQFNQVKAGAAPYTALGTQATANLADPAKAFEASPGYNFALKQGTSNTLGAAGLNGLLRSGAAIKALDKYTVGQAQQDYNNWTGQQQTNANIGLGGLNAFSNAASGSANAAGAAGSNLAAANGVYNGNVNSANNAGYNAIAGGLGTALSSDTLNNLLQSYLSKNKAVAPTGGSSYTMTTTPQYVA